MSSHLLMESQDLVQKFPLLLRTGFKLLVPRANIKIETENYLVETLTDPADLREIFRLRYEVFFREFAGRGNKFSFFPFDLDLHDFVCDHLAVKEKSSGKIVATYRLLFQEEGEARNFYTGGEFDLTSFRKLRGNKLELGRACVHKEYRSGVVISLLWKGLCQYAKKTHTKYMFGCSSLCRKEFASLPFIKEQLQKRNAVVENFDVPVQSKYSLENYNDLNLPSVISETHRSMPSLINMYLLAGAKLGKEIAYDEEMDCLDFFTVLDFHHLPSSFERRFA